MSDEIKLNDPSKKLGEILNIARTNKNISVEELAEKTKITRSYIVALENSQYNELPKLIYVKGFLKIISKELGLDSIELIDRLNEELGLETHESQKIGYEEYFIEEHQESKKHLPSFIKNRVTLIIAIVVVIYICIVIAKVFFGGLSLGNSQHVSVFNAPTNQVVSGSDDGSGSATSGTASSVSKHVVQKPSSLTTSGASISGDSDDNGRATKTVAMPTNVETVDITSAQLQQKMSKMQKDQTLQAAQDSGASID